MGGVLLENALKEACNPYDIRVTRWLMTLTHREASAGPLLHGWIIVIYMGIMGALAHRK